MKAAAFLLVVLLLTVVGIACTTPTTPKEATVEEVDPKKPAAGTPSAVPAPVKELPITLYIELWRDFQPGTVEDGRPTDTGVNASVLIQGNLEEAADIVRSLSFAELAFKQDDDIWEIITPLNAPSLFVEDNLLHLVANHGPVWDVGSQISARGVLVDSEQQEYVFEQEVEVTAVH